MRKTPATLLVMLGLLAGMARGQRSVDPIDQPQFFQIEPIEAVVPGVSAFGWNMALRVLKATYHTGMGLRAGISGLDANGPLDYDAMGFPSGWSIAPVHVGYDIVLNPRRMAFFYGMVPSCYVEATLGAFPPCVKLGAACDIDYCGVGTGVEVGVVDWNHKSGFLSGTWSSLTFRRLSMPRSSSACSTQPSDCRGTDDADCKNRSHSSSTAYHAHPAREHGARPARNRPDRPAAIPSGRGPRAGTLGAALGCESARGSLYILPYFYVGARILKLTYHSGRGLRAGISLYDGGGTPSIEALGLPAGGTFAPVHVGYDIAFQTSEDRLLLDTVPSCYAEATIGAFPLFGRLAAGYDINYWGVGLGVECGATTLIDWDHPSWVVPAIYGVLKLRLLDAAFRLPERR